METLPSIDLRLAERLKNRDFRREWFRAQLEADVPESFRDMREERGMTQADLAAATGMKQSAISRFEGSRDAKWKLETLTKLADALDAQLIISIIRAEDVIARYEFEEMARFSKSSVLNRANQEGGHAFSASVEDGNSVLTRARTAWRFWASSVTSSAFSDTSSRARIEQGRSLWS